MGLNGGALSRGLLATGIGVVMSFMSGSLPRWKLYTELLGRDKTEQYITNAIRSYAIGVLLALVVAVTFFTAVPRPTETGLARFMMLMTTACWVYTGIVMVVCDLVPWPTSSYLFSQLAFGFIASIPTSQSCVFVFRTHGWLCDGPSHDP